MNTASLLARWDCWFSIGEMDCDKYDAWQRVLSDAGFPSSFTIINTPLQRDLVQFEDVPF
jgi:hypothetical protein